jgi:hypothetical protein
MKSRAESDDDITSSEDPHVNQRPHDNVPAGQRPAG